jgi:hypothetical protein
MGCVGLRACVCPCLPPRLSESFLVPPQVPVPAYSRVLSMAPSSSFGGAGSGGAGSGALAGRSTHVASRCSIGGQRPRMSIHIAAETLFATPQLRPLTPQGSPTVHAALGAAMSIGRSASSDAVAVPAVAGWRHGPGPSGPAGRSAGLDGVLKRGSKWLDPTELHLLLDIMSRGACVLSGVFRDAGWQPECREPAACGAGRGGVGWVCNIWCVAQLYPP